MPSMPNDVLRVVEVPRLPPRPADAHKGSFGRVLIVAGSRGMSGAAVLCASATLRGGAGLVRLAVAEEIGPIVAAAQPCYTTSWLPQDGDGRIAAAAEGPLLALIAANDVVAFGPGLGQSADIRQLTAAVLARSDRPLVLDADGINAVVGATDLLRHRAAPLVLTPHPGEFARLLGVDVATVQAQREEHALAFAAEHGLVLLLKGRHTLVTDGRRLYGNTTGNPGMATGGTGDVLTGLIAALMGQGLEAFAAAQLGAWWHGHAGDLARDALGEVSLIASDLLDWLPRALQGPAP
jgi:NAD(P)H-hydrate epimerase